MPRLMPLISPYDYPFVPPAVNPDTKKRWNAKKRRTIGTADNTAPAANNVKLLSNCSDTMLYNPTASVCFSGERRTSDAKMKSLNGAMKLNNAMTATIGFASGKMICQKIRK